MVSVWWVSFMPSTTLPYQRMTPLVSYDHVMVVVLMRGVHLLLWLQVIQRWLLAHFASS